MKHLLLVILPSVVLAGCSVAPKVSPFSPTFTPNLFTQDIQNQPADLLSDSFQLPQMAGTGSGPIDGAQAEDALFALTALALDLDAGRLETVAPTQARATLDGLVTASLTSDGDLATMGNLSLFLDFANNAFTGETSDFANYRYVNDELRRIENLTGTLDLSNTKLLTTVLTADLSGVLSSQADNFSVDADMVGLVTDQNGRIVVMGYIEGQSASAADGIIDITGGIFGAAE